MRKLSFLRSAAFVIGSSWTLALVAGLILAALVTASSIAASAQTPPPVDFVSGTLFSGVGHGDRIPGAANVYTFAVGDFNKDGDLDLVTINDSNVWGLGLVLGNGDGTFQPPIEIVGYDTYGSYGGIVAGDFNKDGNLDFAVLWLVGYGPVQLAVYLNDGTGHFTHMDDYAIGVTGYKMSRSLATADMDGDGDLDLVVADPSNQAVAVLYGNGDGTFQSAIEYYAGATITNTTAVAVGDFNKDGKPDIVVAAWPTIGWTGGINVLLNNGDRTFQPPVSYTNPEGVNDGQVFVADLTGDGNLDVVESSWGNWNIAVFLGNGNGTFQAAKNYMVPSASWVAIGNLTTDKKPELVVSSWFDGTVWVLLNKGSGVFQVSAVYSTDYQPRSIALADFNGDKKLDFVVGNEYGQFMTVALGNGDGTFSNSVHYNESSAWANGIAVADFNLDGSPDVVEAGGGTGVGLSVMLGNTHGVLGAPTSINLGANGNAQVKFVLAGDLNGDGKPDVVSSTAEGYGNPYGVAVLVGLGTGKFKTPVAYPTSTSSYPGAGVLADVNADGNLDIVTSNLDGTMSVLLNKGNGTFGAAIVFPSGTGASASIFVVGDFNGDGKADVVVADFQGNGLWLLVGNGNGTFQSPTSLSSPVRPGGLVAADFNKDGKLDLAIASNDYSGSLTVLLGNGNGTFTPGNTYEWFDDSTCLTSCAHYPMSLVAVDLNGDNNLDLAIAPRNPWYVSCGGYRCAEQYLGAVVYLGKGDGTFVEQTGWLAGISPTWVAAADFNRDGMPDLAYLSNDLNYWTTSLTILQNATQSLSISPLSVVLPGVRNVGTSSSQTVILTNNQSSKLTISSIGLSGGNLGDFSAKHNCGTALGAGLHCTITVTFKPQAPLTRTTSLQITDSLGTQAVPLSGVATEVKLSATSLLFGSVTVGQTKSLPVTLTNFGSTAMSIIDPGIVITGTAAGDYSQTNTCGTSVSAHQSCTITVTFQPTKTGSRSAVLNINDNGGPSPQKVTLSGKGI